MNTSTLNRKLFSFLQSSPTPYHAVTNIVDILESSGCVALDEENIWNIESGQPYFVTRQDGALIVFNIGSNGHQNDGFRIVGSHSDSPCLQIKPHPDIHEKACHRLGIEVYGGALLGPWFDRELSIAGRVCYKTKRNRVVTKLINFNRPVAVIPSLALHFDREANSKRCINAQEDINPLFGLYEKDAKKDFLQHLHDQIANEHNETRSFKILSYDLFCYEHQAPGYTGINNEFIMSSRLDNLLSCFVATQAIRRADRKNNFMFVCNNHEEIGSTTASGAQGNLAISVFERLIPDIATRYSALAKSFFISIDNAHAVHPNFQERSEPAHDIFLNHGPVLKINANQKYSSDSLSNAVFKSLCDDVKVPAQEFVMRNDMICGSTIGPVTAAKLGIASVDVGAATLGMHSIRELTGSKDPFNLLKVIQHFFNKDILPIPEK